MGLELKRCALTENSLQFTFAERAEVDINNPSQLQSALSSREYGLVINCAAYTQVDQAEENQSLALETNGTSVGILAALCQRNNAHLLHISTDYVFDGMSTVPYFEEAIPAPVNVYGRSKLLGEQLIIGKCHYTIIRTSWICSSFGSNFVKSMLRAGRSNDSLNVVADQVGSPTSTEDLGGLLMLIAQRLKGMSWPGGIYHYSSKGQTNWCDFARFIMAEANIACEVNPITTAEFGAVAQRPLYSKLSTNKIVQTLGITIADWQTSVGRIIKELEAE